MKEVALVFVGGGIGSVCRYACGKGFVFLQPYFPVPTVFSNVLSCFIFGLVFGLGISRSSAPQWSLFLLTGVCGGFSTYSSFTFETMELFKSGQSALAFLNIVINFVLSAAGLYLGSQLIKSFA